MPKLFSGVVKFRQNLNFKKMDTASYTWKNDQVFTPYQKYGSINLLQFTISDSHKEKKSEFGKKFEEKLK